jgi:hypothetical protein
MGNRCCSRTLYGWFDEEHAKVQGAVYMLTTNERAEIMLTHWHSDINKHPDKQFMGKFQRIITGVVPPEIFKNKCGNWAYLTPILHNVLEKVRLTEKAFRFPAGTFTVDKMNEIWNMFIKN